MISLPEMHMRLVQQLGEITIHLNSQPGFGPDKVKLSQDIMPGGQQGGMNGQLGGQFPKDAVDLFALGVFQRKDIIVELYRFFRFDERGATGIAFAMEDAFYLTFVLGKDGYYPSAIQK